MRLSRRRRRALGTVLAVAYLGAFAWLVSPLWRPADVPASKRASVPAAPAGGKVGIRPLDTPKALPESLPGSSSVAVATTEAGGEEPLSESGTEATASVPEGGESSASPPSSPEPSSAPQETIISSEG
jgi:hypothetical protein